MRFAKPRIKLPTGFTVRGGTPLSAQKLRSADVNFGHRSIMYAAAELGAQQLDTPLLRMLSHSPLIPKSYFLVSGDDMSSEARDSHRLVSDDGKRSSKRESRQQCVLSPGFGYKLLI
jgi:hypothetical protein